MFICAGNENASFNGNQFQQSSHFIQEQCSNIDKKNIKMQEDTFSPS